MSTISGKPVNAREALDYQRACQIKAEVEAAMNEFKSLDGTCQDLNRADGDVLVMGHGGPKNSRSGLLHFDPKSGVLQDFASEGYQNNLFFQRDGERLRYRRETSNRDCKTMRVETAEFKGDSVTLRESSARIPAPPYQSFTVRGSEIGKFTTLQAARNWQTAERWKKGMMETAQAVANLDGQTADLNPLPGVIGVDGLPDPRKGEPERGESHAAGQTSRFDKGSYLTGQVVLDGEKGAILSSDVSTADGYGNGYHLKRDRIEKVGDKIVYRNEHLQGWHRPFEYVSYTTIKENPRTGDLTYQRKFYDRRVFTTAAFQLPSQPLYLQGDRELRARPDSGLSERILFKVFDTVDDVIQRFRR